MMDVRTEDNGRNRRCRIRSRGNSSPRILSAALLIASLLLVGCGRGSAGSDSATSSPESITQCGNVISLGASGRVSASPSSAESCLWNAYTACHPAVMTYIQQYVDTSVIKTISVQSKAAGCAVTLMVQHANPGRPSVEGNGWPSPTTSGTTLGCSGIQQAYGGLLVTACGTLGDIVIPHAA